MNLKQVRIQNFRNLKDVTVNLNDVNLLIGPNNSGKSNVLHAIRLGSMIVERNLLYKAKTKYANPVNDEEYTKWLTSVGLENDQEICNLSFLFDTESNSESEIYLSLTIFKKYSFETKIEWGITKEINTSMNLLEKFLTDNDSSFLYIEKLREVIIFRQLPLSKKASDTFSNLNGFLLQDTNLIEKSQNIIKKFVNFPIYEIAPKELRKPYGLTSDKFIDFDGSNIVSFFDYLSSSREDIKEELKKTLTLISKDFSGYRLEGLDYVPTEIRNKFPTDTIKRFGLIDSKSYENTIWAEYLSDGILYFLALLCVVHQPYPPPILLLEEPEKGIHPRRIREVMDLLFALAEEKKIQIILTTHSTFVVDEFTDVPENVTVFDNNEETN